MYSPASLSPARLPAGASLRPLVPDDASAVAAIAARLGQTEAGLDDADAWRRKLELFTRDAAACLGLEVDGVLVAYMLSHVKAGEFGLADETAFLELVGVDPAWQGRGLARTLAEALFEHLAELGVRRVLTLVSTRDDTMRPFLRTLGFRPSQLLCLERGL